MADGVTAIILAGGQSRRMGTDKACLPWGPSTVIEHIIGCLRPIAKEVIVTVNDAHRFRHLRATVVEDFVSDAHALGGLYTGLRVAPTDLCFVCACDTPFLNSRLIRFLVQQANGHHCVIPNTPRGLQPLHAVYATSILPTVEEQLRRRRWDLHALVRRVHRNVVEPAVMAQYDPEGLSCFNLNTPADYRRACNIRQTLTQIMEPARVV